MHTCKLRISNEILLLWLTSAAVAANFDIWECEKSKVCAAHPENCLQGTVGGCEYAFSYALAEESPRRYDMELYTRRPDFQFNYVAVGFSHDQAMGNDTVLHCASVGGQPVEVHLSKNPPGKSNKPAGPDVDNATLSLAASESEENHIYCKFSLTYDASVQHRLPDPATQYHLLFARGPVQSAERVSIHDTTWGDPNYPVSTGFKVDLLRRPRFALSANAENATSGQDVAKPTVSSEDQEGGPISPKYSTRLSFSRLHGMGLFGYIFHPHHHHDRHDYHHDHYDYHYDHDPHDHHHVHYGYEHHHVHHVHNDHHHHRHW